MCMPDKASNKVALFLAERLWLERNLLQRLLALVHLRHNDTRSPTDMVVEAPTPRFARFGGTFSWMPLGRHTRIESDRTLW